MIGVNCVHDQVSFLSCLTYSLILDFPLVKLQMVTLQRIKHMVGYKESDQEALEKLGYNLVLTDFEHYGPGDVRTVQEFLDHNQIDMKTEKCGGINYCNECTLP